MKNSDVNSKKGAEVKNARQEIRLSYADKERLRIVAEKKGINVTELIMISLEPYLKKFEE